MQVRLCPLQACEQGSLARVIPHQVMKGSARGHSSTPNLTLAPAPRNDATEISFLPGDYKIVILILL